MNKWKALLLGLVFLSVALVTLPTPGAVFGWVFLVIALGYLAIAGYKLYRDWYIVSQAEAERVAAAQRPQALPPMSSPGSRRLFVPPPLKNK